MLGLCRTEAASSNLKRYSLIAWAFAMAFSKSTEQGAHTLMHCVLTGKNLNGKYYRDCRPSGALHPMVLDADARQTVYDKTAELLQKIQ